MQAAELCDLVQLGRDTDWPEEASSRDTEAQDSATDEVSDQQQHMCWKSQADQAGVDSPCLAGPHCDIEDHQNFLNSSLLPEFQPSLPARRRIEKAS